MVMTLEVLLASFHVVAILTLVVFLASQAALCRSEWLNAAVVERLVRLDQIYRFAMVALLVSGVVRVAFGIKGMSWYVSQPMLHAKIALVVVMLLLAVQPSRAFRRWRSQWHATGALPGVDEVGKARKQLMRQAHVVPVIAVLAMFWVRGW
jgi:putative membrane protein